MPSFSSPISNGLRKRLLNQPQERRRHCGLAAKTDNEGDGAQERNACPVDDDMDQSGKEADHHYLPFGACSICVLQIVKFNDPSDFTFPACLTICRGSDVQGRLYGVKDIAIFHLELRDQMRGDTHDESLLQWSHIGHTTNHLQKKSHQRMA